MSLSHSPKVVTDGLVLYLDAANQRSYPKSGTTWSDLAGANDGTLTNVPTFDSANKGSIVFDGANTYIDLGASMDTNVPISVSCWFKADQEQRYQGLVSRSDGGTSFRNFILYISNVDGAGGFGTYINAHRRILGLISINTWYNGCFTLDSSNNLKLYLNASLVRSDTSVSYTDQPSDKLLIGEFQAGGGSDYPLDGNISNVSIYNRALTGDEVRQNYLATRGRYK
jgi:hypothetical protein